MPLKPQKGSLSLSILSWGVAPALHGHHLLAWDLSHRPKARHCECLKKAHSLINTLRLMETGSAVPPATPPPSHSHPLELLDTWPHSPGWARGSKGVARDGVLCSLRFLPKQQAGYPMAAWGGGEWRHPNTPQRPLPSRTSKACSPPASPMAPPSHQGAEWPSCSSTAPPPLHLHSHCIRTGAERASDPARRQGQGRAASLGRCGQKGSLRAA